MAFCEKEPKLIDSGYTCVDNKFLINYLPEAPDMRSAVYLLGLTLADSAGTDNSLDTIALKLNISREDVLDAYRYWEELGLVHIVDDADKKVIYLDVRSTASALKKIKPSKYAKFSKDMQAVISGRMITVNEYNEYYMFLENTTFEPSALVSVAKYCVETKGNDINYAYILTVARNQLKKGATTLAAVQERLNGQQKYDDDLKLVFKALKISRAFDYSDREMYEKWTKEMGFTQDVVVKVASRVKTGGMTKLDGLMSDYYKHGTLSVSEIDDYESNKTRLYDLAKAVTNAIGVYYQSLDSVVDEYIVGWLQKGYDDETLLAVAKYCFRSGIRTLAGLAAIIDKFFKNGVTTLSALEAYLANVAQKDEQIKRVLDCANLDRRVTANDRALFRTWTEKWQISLDGILYVAEQAAGTVSPLAYINKVLADCKQAGATTAEQIRNRKEVAATKTTATKAAVVGNAAIERRQYTDEQLNALFSALNDTED